MKLKKPKEEARKEFKEEVNLKHLKETLTENIFDKTFKEWSKKYKIPEYEFWEMMDGFRIPEDRHLEVFEKELEIKKYLFKKK